MSRYIPKVCPNCGANLDPDERCDCREHPYRGVPREEPKISRERILAILAKVGWRISEQETPARKKCFL